MKQIVLGLKGMVIGLSMLIPGVSGGTMAVIMGIFDDLVNAIGSLFKTFKKSFMVLFPIGVGAVLGILVFVRPITWMLDYLYVPTMFLFIGGVLGGLPALVKEAGISKKTLSVKGVVCFLAGVAIVLLINLLPKDMLDIESQSTLVNAAILFGAGVISAVAFVLPGISGSYMLLLLGMYDTMMRAVGELNILLLLPLGLGIIVGVLLIGRLMQFLLKRFRGGTYMVILGFVLSSLVELYPGLPQGLDWLWSILFFVGAGLLIFFLSRYEEKKNAAALSAGASTSLQEDAPS